jgi:hypothetical protein
LEGFQFLSIHPNGVAGFYLIACIGFASVEEYQPSFNKPVGFAPGTKAAFADEFIDAYGTLLHVAVVV